MRGFGASAQPCPFFEYSSGECVRPDNNPGLCGRPLSGTASALVQHADQAELCRRNPPYGMQPLCRTDRDGSARKMLRELRDPPKCRYSSCAVVGAGGTLLGARLGAQIDGHEAVIRVNFAPDGPMAARTDTAPHRHEPTWTADVGQRTTWRVITMEGYGYLRHYPRFWLKPPRGHGSHDNMSGIPQTPLLAVTCHTPSANMGRCSETRLRQVFSHPWAASYLINPLLLRQTASEHFRGVRNQKTLSTGMTAIAFAREMCGEVRAPRRAPAATHNQARGHPHAHTHTPRTPRTPPHPRLEPGARLRLWQWLVRRDVLPLLRLRPGSLQPCGEPVDLPHPREGFRRLPQLLGAGERAAPHGSAAAARAALGPMRRRHGRAARRVPQHLQQQGVRTARTRQAAWRQGQARRRARRRARRPSRAAAWARRCVPRCATSPRCGRRSARPRPTAAATTTCCRASADSRRASRSK